MFFKASRPAAWEDALRDYNRDMESPLEDRELASIIRNLGKQDYTYQCKSHPLEAFCQRRPCKKQPFGIDFFIRQKRMAAMPEIAGLVKVLTEPPSYKVSIDGAQVECSLDQIVSPILFKKLCFERRNIVVSQPKQHEWDEVLQGLSDAMTEEAAPDSASAYGLLRSLLAAFLGTRTKSDSLDDILLGRAASGDDGRVYFRVEDFLPKLSAHPKKYSISDVYFELRRVGLATRTATLKGAVVELWSVPEPQDQTEPFDHPIDATPRAV
jgi:hypothetical protein